VPDLPGNLAPLSAGIPIHAPEDPTPGAMRADASPAANNVATLAFDVVVDGNVLDGTVISNQAFVSALAGGVVDQPSDDPATPVPDDPTRDIVGNLPLLFAAKDVAIQVDGGTPGVVDPGDVLRYTITLSNSGAITATNVSLRDSVPANTTYVADSLTLNGLPVGQPDGGVSPLTAGIPVSSTNLTPPLPAPGMGTVTAGGTAVVEFDLRVDNGVPAGTIISNQALVTSAELPNLLTDGDGNPATGPEPTIVVVGDGQQLIVTKSVAVVGGGAALPGSQLEYSVRVVNVATVPASNVVITDDLDLPVAGQLAYVPASATLNGAPAGISVVGSLITADYSTSNGPLPPGQTVVLRFLATIDAGLAIGTTITNTGVVTWNVPPQTASADVSVDVGGMPGVGLLSGTLWHDADFDTALGGGERTLGGWTVELYRNAQVVHSALTDAGGAYQISGLEPNDANGDQYALRFRAPGAGATTGSLGRAASPFTNGPQEITDIVVTSGSNLLDLNLPIQPNGVVYDSVQRVPIAGARVSLLNGSSGAALPAACFDDPVQQGQVTVGDGYYKFDLNFSSAACPSGGSYIIGIAGAAAGYANGFSGIIPPITDASTTPLSVPTCPGSVDDAVPATAQHCEVQTSEFAPPSSVAARTPGTNFHTHLVLDSSQMPGSSQLFNNHLAMDPVADSAVAISKTTPSMNVMLGQPVPYEITVRNQVAVDLLDLSIIDRFPAGFRYVKGSAKLDGVAIEPTIDGRELVWTGIDVTASGSRTLVLLLAVGAGVSEGEYTNRAQVISTTGSVALSGEASATVRVVPDPDFACTDVMGKVFADTDRDGFQDPGERGLEGVRLVTPRGLIATTDPYGRFHISCAIVPHPERGSNMVLKLDDRSLPSGYRLSTRQLQVKRATRGKALRFNFGASIHRVVGLDLADAVFEPGTTEMRQQWRERIPLLLEELQKSPATLRLAYVADVEDAQIVDRRLAAVKKEIIGEWEALDGDPLTIEPEIYWRRGAPPDGPMTRLPGVGRWASMAASGLGASLVVEAEPGIATERILSPEEPLTQWTQDPERLATESGDRLEERDVLTEEAETVKLKNVVPPIRFDSGVSEIPPSTVEKLRSVLDEMQHLDNVRLHLIGHADDQPLSRALAGTYGDNEGLSRERAGEVAEFVQAALHLPPEAISFSWAGDAEPLASNATSEGRAQNRRVEVEVWYDEFEEKVAVEEVIVSEDIKRVKVCRLETVCKMRFREGHERRARVKNLIAPLQTGEENARVSKDFVRQVGQALHNLRDKQGVTVKFIGFTDNAP
ncbi:MAG: OmpA family protein, partial [Myxococcales bacterium]|nr:OmpA family protein [Myxococcales bacterium]